MAAKKRGVWASDFANGEGGTDADPWPISAITAAADYVCECDEELARKVLLDGGVFRGSTSIVIDSAGTGNPSGLVLEGVGMGGTGTTGMERFIGRGTTIDYTGTGTGISLGAGGVGAGNIHRVIFRDFTLKGTSSATSGILWDNVFRGLMENVFVFGFTKDSVDNWGIHTSNCFAGQFQNLYVHNCMNGVWFQHGAGNGYQAQIGFIEIDTYNLNFTGATRTALKVTGILGCVIAPVMIVAIGRSPLDTRGVWIEGCRACTFVSPYVEGAGTAGVHYGFYIENSQGLVLTSPLVTRCGGTGFYSANTNANPPDIFDPVLGAGSGDDSTGDAFSGRFGIIRNPHFNSDWTGSKYIGTFYDNCWMWDDAHNLRKPRNVLSWEDDFIGDALRDEYNGVQQDSGTAPTVDGTGEDGGTVKLSTGATTGGSSTLQFGRTHFRTDLQTVLETRVKISDVSECDAYIGFRKDADEYAWYHCDNPTFRLETDDGGVDGPYTENPDTLVWGDDTFNHLSLELVDTETARFQFGTTGTLRYRQGTVGAVTDALMDLYIHIVNTSDTDVTLTVDFLRLYQSR